MASERKTRKAERNADIMRLRRQGMSLRDIADRVGVSYQRVDQIVNAELLRAAKLRESMGVDKAKVESPRTAPVTVPVGSTTLPIRRRSPRHAALR